MDLDRKGQVKTETCLASPPASFLQAASFFILFFILLYYAHLKNKTNYDFFILFEEGLFEMISAKTI